MTEEECYFDQKGIEIKENDLLRVFHFIGARRKVHYLHKIAVLKESKGIKYWAGKCYYSDHSYWLKGAANKENRVLYDTLIVNHKDWESPRKKVNVHTKAVESKQPTV